LHCSVCASEQVTRAVRRIITDIVRRRALRGRSKKGKKFI
jgi:hypothetical protein